MDFNVDNMLYDGCMYFCNLGGFIFKRNTPNGEIYRNNISQLNIFVLDDLSGLVKISKVKKMVYDSNYDKSECLSWQKGEMINGSESIKQHIKRMTK